MSAWALAGFIVADLAEAATDLGDSDTAQRAVIKARNIARRTGALSHQALESFAAAWALLACDRHDDAARAASRAVDGLRRAGHVLLAARAHVAYATAARHRDRSGAVDALRNAATAFDDCGAARRAAQARMLLTQLDTPGRRVAVAVTGPDSLTAREREVAELAVCGCTARQIADRLYIGIRTVETHLANIYPKLGVSSKRELIYRAPQLGLTPTP
jgi:ATP/maltotriose-dependent transcriptional regulator MalT